MDGAPLAEAFAHATRTRFTGALILRRPNGESYTVTLFEGLPQRVFPGPDKPPPGTELVPLDSVRAIMLADALPAHEATDPDARARQALRRLVWVANLPGQCFNDPSLRVESPATQPPPPVAPRAQTPTDRPAASPSTFPRRISIPPDPPPLRPMSTPLQFARQEAPLGEAPRTPTRRPSEIPPSRRVSVPETQGPGAAPAGDIAAQLRLARGRAAKDDFAEADRILREGIPLEDRDAEARALSAWVRANLQGDLDRLLVPLDLALLADPTCEHTLFYRGLILKRAGRRKAALRDFVTLARRDPHHGAALREIETLRGAADE